jgi:hypothetical protein
MKSLTQTTSAILVAAYSRLKTTATLRQHFSRVLEQAKALNSVPHRFISNPRRELTGDRNAMSGLEVDWRVHGSALTEAFCYPFPASSWRVVGHPYLGIVSGLPVLPSLGSDSPKARIPFRAELALNWSVHEMAISHQPTNTNVSACQLLAGV